MQHYGSKKVCDILEPKGCISKIQHFGRNNLNDLENHSELKCCIFKIQHFGTKIFNGVETYFRNKMLYIEDTTFWHKHK